jgi:hypothetical protein
VTDVWTDGLIDMCIPVYQLHLKRRGYSIFSIVQPPQEPENVADDHREQIINNLSDEDIPILRCGFTNSIIISLCLIKWSNQMCDGRLDGRTDRHVHPSTSTPLKAF